MENAFANLKALQRKAAERGVEALWSVLAGIANTFAPGECDNYFAAAGDNPGWKNSSPP